IDHARLSADSDDEPDLFESRRSFARPSAADHVFGARAWLLQRVGQSGDAISAGRGLGDGVGIERRQPHRNRVVWRGRSEEHTSELQSLMRISYAVFCLK